MGIGGDAGRLHREPAGARRRHGRGRRGRTGRGAQITGADFTNWYNGRIAEKAKGEFHWFMRQAAFVAAHSYYCRKPIFAHSGAGPVKLAVLRLLDAYSESLAGRPLRKVRDRNNTETISDDSAPQHDDVRPGPRPKIFWHCTACPTAARPDCVARKSSSCGAIWR